MAKSVSGGGMWEVIAAGVMLIFSVFCLFKHYSAIKRRKLNAFRHRKR